ncbi:MAG: DUF1615 domain-containing protein [Gallionella sp.]|nr:DUF1615 domain-containing protein [Gallionella sp.]
MTHCPILSNPIDFDRYIVRYSNHFLLLLMVVFTTACATTPPPKPPSPPPVVPPPVTPVVIEQPKPKPVRPKPAPPKVIVPPAPPAASATDPQIHALVVKLFPDKVQYKDGWANDIQTAFKALQVPPTTENFCAVIAIIGQESGFQADPVVPNLPAIAWREIHQRSEKYSIPQTVLDWSLNTKSQDGRSYHTRIDALKTEKELSDLVEEIIESVPAGNKLFHNYNPVHTGGPMQVSVAFAEGHAQVRPYPYPIPRSLRSEVFTRRGGIYFGSAILLDYPVPYQDILYRFADFNAGRYSSRNAAFQHALSRVSGQEIACDGDLLRYKNGNPSDEPSSTLKILLSMSTTLKMSDADIQRDVLLEKATNFHETTLYTRVFGLAEKTGQMPRATLPEIDIKSPKFKRKLTTQWFATRVDTRFRTCLQQGGVGRGVKSK